MLSNGWYIHKELANTQGEHLFPQIAFAISCHALLQIKFHANVFYGIDIIVFDQQLCITSGDGSW